MINRLILCLSLVGMILALHLWIQKSRGFDQGCLGLEKPVFVEEGDCAEVSALPASHLLGISNAAWGYAFYFGLALLTFGKIVLSERTARRLHLLSEIAVTAALLYSGYLVFQMAQVSAWCVLCLISAALVTLLFALHVILRRRGGFQPVTEASRGIELGLATGSLFAAVGVLVGVLLFVDRLGTRPLDQGSTDVELQRIVGRTLPKFLDAAHLREVRACRFDDQAPRLDLKKLISPDTPFLGNPDGIPVIAFYDPNCGFCRQHHVSFRQLVERHGDRAKFYLIPRRLWAHSELQIAALHVAAGEGRYFELWDKLFGPAFAPRTGMDLAQIETIFRELGLRTNDLAARLEAAKPAADAEFAAAKAAGIRGTPAVFIDGARVAAYNHSPRCIGTLIERRAAASATAGSTGTTDEP